ncbi:N-acetylmuramoyl-L-alanine amidase [Brevibacillus sp. AG]|uniref:N-acetylmuramoyl-L-alanine amidase family protein n=1 Tax=Brevibacillus sp. AG TaxID=3020891 RepID=UPI00232E3FE3|nr:N-acetylmuramoyl-L-alanine amidase [Brevibacillus sp. AG]MDC0760643.1 N-acetylmuramoyl-L-alanine amidase [Brevibacillus sp. AG]
MDLKGKKILLDPGHGGAHPGKTHKDRQEKDVTLKISKVLENLLEEEGATVYMTRTRDKDFGGESRDEDVNERVKYINKKYAGKGIDVLLSIHVNTDRLVSRVGVLYPEKGKASKILAQNLARKYGTFMANTGYGEADLAILRDTKVAGAKALIETGKINQSWYDDDEEVERAAFAIVAGFYDYFREIE